MTKTFLDLIDSTVKLSQRAIAEVVLEAMKIEHSLPFRFGQSTSGGAIWPNKRSLNVKYARKRRFRGGKFKW